MAAQDNIQARAREIAAGLVGKRAHDALLRLVAEGFRAPMILDADYGPLHGLMIDGLAGAGPHGGYLPTDLGRAVAAVLAEDTKARELAASLHSSLPPDAIAAIIANPTHVLMRGCGTLNLNTGETSKMTYEIAMPQWRDYKRMFGGERWSSDGSTIAVIGTETECEAMCRAIAIVLAEQNDER